MNQITDEQIMSTLREVVAERPDYVYAKPEHMCSPFSCLYVHTDENGENPEPGCLVGHVLHRLGVPLEFLSEYEGSLAAVVLEELNISAELADGKAALTRAQKSQDTGHSWRSALMLAEAKGDSVA